MVLSVRSRRAPLGILDCRVSRKTPVGGTLSFRQPGCPSDFPSGGGEPINPTRCYDKSSMESAASGLSGRSGHSISEIGGDQSPTDISGLKLCMRIDLRLARSLIGLYG